MVVLLADPDRAPWYAPDTRSASSRPSGTRPSLPSAWPLAAALALGLFVVAAATNAILVVAAVVLAVVVGPRLAAGSSSASTPASPAATPAA